MQSDNEIWSVHKKSIRNIFLEKACAKCGGESIPRPFFEKSKLRMDE